MLKGHKCILFLLQKYIYHVSSQSFEFRYHTIQHVFQDVFNIGGYYANTELCSEKISSIIEKYKPELALVASKYIEKIKN